METTNAVNSAQLFMLVRTALQMACAALGWERYLNNDVMTALVTLIVAVLLVGWGWIARSNKNLVADAAGVPQVKKVIADPNFAAAVPSDKVVPPPPPPKTITLP